MCDAPKLTLRVRAPFVERDIQTQIALTRTVLKVSQIREENQELEDEENIPMNSSVPTVTGQTVEFRRTSRDRRKPRRVVTATYLGDPHPDRPKAGEDPTAWNADRLRRQREAARQIGHGW